MPRNTDVAMRMAENSHHYVHCYYTEDECHELHIPRNNTDANENGQREIHTDNGIEIYHLSVVNCMGDVLSTRYKYERVSSIY